MFFGTYTNFIPNARAAQTTSTVDHGLIIMNQVAGVDLSKYMVSTNSYSQNSYLGVLPQENIQYTFQSNNSKLQIIDTFTNGSLRIINVLSHSESPFTTLSITKPVDMAKSFLTSYQAYLDNKFYGSLALSLSNIDSSKNSTSVNGETQLDIINSNDSTTFRWTYVYGGIQAPAKSVDLSYRDGFLEYFVDNWNFYTIGNTSIVMPEKEAINNGLRDAQSYSWTMGTGNNTVKFKDFKVAQAMMWETIFSNGVTAETARNKDPLTLYPMRHVWVSLDKSYPGNVYGVEVFYWADTKDLYRMQERYSNLEIPQNLFGASNSAKNSELFIDPFDSSIALAALASMAFVLSVFWIFKRSLVQSKILKIGGILLCFLLIFSIFMLPISKVSATVNRNAIVWGSKKLGVIRPRSSS